MAKIKRIYLFPVILGIIFNLITPSYQIDATNISLDQLNSFDPEIAIPQPKFVTVNPNTNMIYVANAWDIFKINGSSNKLLGVIPLISRESSLYINGLALNPTTDKLYVICNNNSLIGNNTIYVIKNGQTGKEVWNGQGYLQFITVNPNTNLIYVANHGNITVINGISDEIVNNIKLPRIVKSIVVNPVDDIIYVSTFLVGVGNSGPPLLVIDGKTNKVLTQIPIPVRTWDMYVDPKINNLFLSAEGGSRIFVINGSSNALVNGIVAGNFSAYEVDKIAVNPNTHRIYMTHSNSGTVSVIDESTGLISQIKVGQFPSAIAVNPNTNMVYVANTDSSTLSVINGYTDTNDPTQPQTRTPGINVGNQPADIAVNPNTNMVYVANTDSKTLSVINGSSDKVVSNILIAHGPSQIVINQNTNTIYIHTFDRGLTIINGSTNKIVQHIPNLGSVLTSIDWPDLSVGISAASNRIYVASERNITEIDGKTNKHIGNLELARSIGAIFPNINSTQDGGDRIYALSPTTTLTQLLIYGPTTTLPKNYTLYMIDIKNNKGVIKNVIQLEKPYHAISINHNTNITYLTSADDNTFSALDLDLHKITTNLRTGSYPMDLAVNPNNSMVYVVNRDSNTVSIIDEMHIPPRLIRNIRVGNVPTAVAVNPNTNLVYVTDSGSNTVSVINGSVNQVVVGVRFTVNPPNVGHINCSNTEITTNEYIRLPLGTQCIAEANLGFRLGSWAENLGHNSSRTILTPEVPFNITRYGSFAANFEKIPPTFTIPPELLYGVILGPIVGSVIGWLLPFFRSPRSKGK